MNAPKLRFKADDRSDYPGWEEKKLGDNIKFINGRAYLRDELLPVGKYKVLRVGNLFTNDTYYYSDMELEPDKYIEEGDLIYAWSATFGPRVYHGNKCIYHYHIWKLEFDKKMLSRDFLNYLLQHDVERIKSQRTGGTMIHITKAAMEKRQLMIPSFPEQQKIASFLSSVDEVIAKSEAEVAAWEKRKKGVVQKIFSQEVRFKKDDGSDYPDWEERRFGEIMTCYSGGTPSAKNTKYYGGNIAFMRSGEIHQDYTKLFLTEEGYENSSAKMIHIGDLIYALYGATSGEVDISKIDAAINQAILCIVPKKDNRYYLKQWLAFNKMNITNKLLQGGQGNLSAELIKGVFVPIPCLVEQQKIADCLSTLDDVINQCKAELEKWKLLKKGLLQQMFV